MSVSDRIQEAARLMAKQASALGAAREAAEAADNVALMICLNMAAIHSGQCGHRLLDAMEELAPAASAQAKTIKATRLQ
jgi:hypothetical protein